MRAKPLIPAVLAGFALAVAGCGGDDNSNTTTAQKPPPKTAAASKPAAGSSTLQLAADPSGKIAFDKKTLQGKSGKNTLQFTNSSQIPHAVEVEGNGLEEQKTQTIQGGKASLTLNLKPGTYEFYCPVDSHKAQGMKGTITVK